VADGAKEIHMPDSTATAPARQARDRKNGKLRHARVSLIPLEKLRPSPENDRLYKPVDPTDPEMVELARSVKAHGVQEQLIVTADYWIVSGHRRLVAAKRAGLVAVPCKVLDFRKHEDHDRFMHLLREYNRQRVKSFDEKLREETLSANPEVGLPITDRTSANSFMPEFRRTRHSGRKEAMRDLGREGAVFGGHPEKDQRARKVPAAE
jgi:hypothetical protein